MNTGMNSTPPKATHSGQPQQPPAPWRPRGRAFGFVLGVVVFVALSFASLDLQWGKFLSFSAFSKMGRFLAELTQLETSARFIRKLLMASVETLAMSVVGTLLAVLLGLGLALPASKTFDGDAARWRGAARFVLNALRSIPELIWATLLLIAAGLGPFAGTLALGLHTTGVLGRLFAEAIENAPPGPGEALRVRGVPEGRVFVYATLPLVLPQLVSYTLYRWENNIRAAAVLGVVGAGGLGQMLAFHMGLFQMGETGSILLAMLVLVALVDALSHACRRQMSV